MNESWSKVLHDEMEKSYFKELMEFLDQEKKNGVSFFPNEELIFEAFNRTPFENVKVVIVGQDPYHGKGQAHGLSFSVPPGQKIPPSLKNIFKELKRDLLISEPHDGCLTSWADQGVLLLNATLTVREGEPKSHDGRGWEIFTDAVIKKLIEKDEPLVFLLWGKSAQEKIKNVLVNCCSKHLILIAGHPSPFSAHLFIGCSHFSKTNHHLKMSGKKEINWQI